MDAGQFAEHVLKKIREAAVAAERQIIAGISDQAEYRQRVGYVAGLRRAESEIIEANKTSTEDE